MHVKRLDYKRFVEQLTYDTTTAVSGHMVPLDHNTTRPQIFALYIELGTFI